jgi:hypothetical protein
MKQVYIVTKGAYSEYDILSVYLTEEEAISAVKRYVEKNKIPYGGIRVEKWVTGEVSDEELSDSIIFAL